MKFKFLRIPIWLMCLSLALGFTVISCDDDDDDDNLPANEVRFQNLTLTGANEVPAQANPSPNTGTINAVYNKDTNVISYTITWTGFEATAMHFHKIADPQAGPVTLPIPKSPATATTYTSPLTGSLTLTDAQEVELLANQWYLNIHSQTYPGGEIRVNMVPN